MNIVDIISSHARLAPDRPAIINGAATLCYRDLDLAIRRTATYLRSQDLCAGQGLGICLKDTPEHLILFFAAVRLGMTAASMDWRSLPPERVRIASALDLDIVAVEPGAAGLPGTATMVIDQDWLLAAAATGVDTTPALSTDAPYAIVLSSGSTGAPKGYLMTHRQALARLTSNWLGYGWSRGERYFAAAPFVFNIGRDYPLFQLLAGNTVILYPTLFDPGEFVEAVNRSAATIAFAAPPLIRRFLQMAPEAGSPLFPGLRSLWVSGAPLDRDEKIAARHLLSPFMTEVYGAAAIGLISYLKAADFDTKADSVGRPVGTVTVEIVDENGEARDIDETGVLRCRGPSLALCSTESGAASADPQEGLRDGWYYPGDLAVRGEDGHIYLTGRVADTIIRGDPNIDPAEIETILRSHESILDAAVVARADKTAGEEPVAFVVVAGDVTAVELRAHTRARLAAHKVPAEFISTESLPRGAAGKVLKGELRKRLA